MCETVKDKFKRYFTDLFIEATETTKWLEEMLRNKGSWSHEPTDRFNNRFLPTFNKLTKEVFEEIDRYEMVLQEKDNKIQALTRSGFNLDKESQLMQINGSCSQPVCKSQNMKINTMQKEISGLENEIIRLKDDKQRMEEEHTKEIDDLQKNRELNKYKAEMNDSVAEIKHHQRIDSQTFIDDELAVHGAVTNDFDDTLPLFNTWAANPQLKLPSKFYYIDTKGEPKTRSTQVFRITNSPTKWIMNEGGIKKYLFPNPIFFDMATDIGTIYKMEGGSLKPEGQNRIKIIKPCEIKDSGYIEYKGELRIL